MEKSSFFNSVNGDRKYQASDFASYFNSLLTNGVFPNPSTNLQVIANNNMTVTIKAGKAWINGYCYINDSDLILPVSVADGVLNRIDRIVVQFNTINRNITTKVKKGVFASTPIVTALQRDADIFELGIGDIYVGKGATSISQANITDLRMNTSLCGWVNSLIQADTTAIFNQYLDWFTTKTGQYQADMVVKQTDFTNQFNNWFTTIQGQLSGDIAGNLLNQIDSNSDKITVLNGSGAVKEKVNKEEFDTFKTANATSLEKMGSQAVGKGASLIGINDSGNKFTATNVEGALSELFTNVDNGKNSVYSAIVGKGITPASKDFSALATGVNAIAKGQGNATEDEVLSGSTFTNADGVLRTGNITKRGAVIITPSSVNQTIPVGYHNGNGVVLPAISTIAGTNIIYSDVRTLTFNNVTTYTKAFEVKVNYGGIVRVNFDMYHPISSSLYARIYVNGIAVGIARTSFSLWRTFTEDIAVNANDLVQIYIQTTAGTDIYVRNFSIGVGNLAIAPYVGTAGYNSKQSVVGSVYGSGTTLTVTGLTFTAGVVVVECQEPSSGYIRYSYLKGALGNQNALALTSGGDMGTGIVWTITSTSISVTLGGDYTGKLLKIWAYEL